MKTWNSGLLPFLTVLLGLFITTPASAECKCGTQWVDNGVIVCDYIPYPWGNTYVCWNDGDCQEIQPEDPEWSPTMCDDEPQAILMPKKMRVPKRIGIAF